MDALTALSAARERMDLFLAVQGSSLPARAGGGQGGGAVALAAWPPRAVGRGASFLPGAAGCRCSWNGCGYLPPAASHASDLRLSGVSGSEPGRALARTGLS